jgi:energy-coupling factor transporter ATP-binding protein EcfA2
MHGGLLIGGNLMSDLGAAEAKLAIKLIELAVKQGWIDRLVDALKKKHRIIVLGSTGAGKTNFIDSLTALVPKTIGQMERTEFAKHNAIKISKSPFIFVDTPGQLHHHSRRIKAIREAMRKKIAGVINVVSFGYHEGRTGKREALRVDGTIKESFLEKNRKVEIEALDDWKILLGGRETVDWLITVVTKADLWWNQRDEVLEYYQRGAYYEALGTAQSLNPVVLEYCSVFHKFFGEGPLSGTFDEDDRVRLRAHLLRELLSAVSEE